MWSILWDAKDSPALCALDISSDLGAAIEGQGAHTSCETQEWIEGTRTDKKCCTESSKKDGTCSPYHYLSRIWSFYLFWAFYWHLRPFKIPGAVTSMGAHWLRGLPQTAACQKSPQMCQLLTTGQERQQADHGYHHVAHFHRIQHDTPRDPSSNPEKWPCQTGKSSSIHFQIHALGWVLVAGAWFPSTIDGVANILPHAAEFWTHLGHG